MSNEPFGEGVPFGDVRARETARDGRDGRGTRAREGRID